jgi:hypothetical protein
VAPESNGEGKSMHSTHRVALELEVEVDADLARAEPEDWDLQDLTHAIRTGHARPVRTIQGLVVDTEHDRLSCTLRAIAEDLGETVQLHWLATAEPWPQMAPTLRSPRPPLEILVELDHLAASARAIAQRLACEGL